MDMQYIGRRISKARKALGITQDQLAEKIGVSAQAVSKWENGRNLPDMDNLNLLAQTLRLPVTALTQAEKTAPDFTYRSRLFDEEHMFTRIRTLAQAEGLNNTLKALEFMREKHQGQTRKPSRYATEEVAYINHPLMMACHAHAMGIRDDAVLAALLLHDVVEDTDAVLDDLPVSGEVKAIVDLVTFRCLDGRTKEESKAVYYQKIRKNKEACLLKVIDRCNNVSTMAGSFKRERLVSYIQETEKYVFPLIDEIKGHYPAYSDAAFLLKYQMISLLESIKALL